MPERTSHRNHFSDLVHNLLDLLGEIADDNASENNVHKLRTSVRRLEVALVGTPTNGTKKLSKQLTILRRSAGRVRDADVQLEMLGGLRSLGYQAPIDELSGWLRRRRAKYQAKLTTAVKNSTGLVKRLQRLRRALKGHEENQAGTSGLNAVQGIRERYLALSAAIPQGGDALHDFRKRCKQLRYELEPFPAPEARQLVSRLKQVQDSIGAWHDWEELELHAEKGLKRRSFSLSALLRSRARSARIEARRSAEELRNELLAGKPRRPISTRLIASEKSLAR